MNFGAFSTKAGMKISTGANGNQITANNAQGHIFVYVPKHRQVEGAREAGIYLYGKVIGRGYFDSQGGIGVPI